MKGNDVLEPQSVAALDQIIASYSDWLGKVVDSYRYLVDTGQGDLVTLAVMSTWLEEDFDQATTASMLGVAIRMLAERR